MLSFKIEAGNFDQSSLAILSKSTKQELPANAMDYRTEDLHVYCQFVC